MAARTFLITGASRGIGFATALALADIGAKVVGIARTEPSEFPGEFVVGDLGSAESTQATLEALTAKHEFDGVVNSFGVAGFQPLGAIDLATHGRIVDENLRPAIQVTQALLPRLKAQGWGRIVNLSSLTVVGIPNRTSYSAAKAGMIALTRTWAIELGRSGITVNAVAPGATGTETFLRNNPPDSAGMKMFVEGTPMRRIGRPEEIASAVAFLMSDGASYVNGQTLFVDGGASVGTFSF